MTLICLLLLPALKETPGKAWVQHGQSAAAEVHRIMLYVAQSAKARMSAFAASFCVGHHEMTGVLVGCHQRP